MLEMGRDTVTASKYPVTPWFAGVQTVRLKTDMTMEREERKRARKLADVRGNIPAQGTYVGEVYERGMYLRATAIPCS